MDIDLVPSLIDQFRETFEGMFIEGVCWIVDPRPNSGIFGAIEALTGPEAFAPPVEGARSIASHVEHLRFTLDLTYQRIQGENPKADWPGSFNLPGAATEETWKSLQRELRRAYDAVLGEMQKLRSTPPQNWPPIVLAGMVAMTAHNAYHLGAIKQIANVVRIR